MLLHNWTPAGHSSNDWFKICWWFRSCHDLPNQVTHYLVHRLDLGLLPVQQSYVRCEILTMVHVKKGLHPSLVLFPNLKGWGAEVMLRKPQVYQWKWGVLIAKRHGGSWSPFSIHPTVTLQTGHHAGSNWGEPATHSWVLHRVRAPGTTGVICNV